MTDTPPTDSHQTTHETGGTQELRAQRPEASLPPVQAPTAGFLMQLFLIPLVIVSILVSVWLGLNWLAHMGTRPAELVDQLEDLDLHSWQQAHTLAEMLGGRQYSEVRQNRELAQRLALILTEQCEAASDQPEQIQLRIYLCTALSRFEVPDGIPALIAATDARQPVVVRQAAIEAIAMLANQLGTETLVRHDGLITALFSASEAQTNQADQQQATGVLRSRAAYALGVLGDAQSTGQLVQMLADPFPDARFNAAAGLARQKDLRAMPRLLEMLELENVDIVEFEQTESEKLWKRQVVWDTAIQAIQEMADVIPSEQCQAVREALTKLMRADSGRRVQLRSKALLNHLEKHCT